MVCDSLKVLEYACIDSMMVFHDLLIKGKAHLSNLISSYHMTILRGVYTTLIGLPDLYTFSSLFSKTSGCFLIRSPTRKYLIVVVYLWTKHYPRLHPLLYLIIYYSDFCDPLQWYRLHLYSLPSQQLKLLDQFLCVLL